MQKQKLVLISAFDWRLKISPGSSSFETLKVTCQPEEVGDYFL